MAEFVQPPSDAIQAKIEETIAVGLEIASNDDGWEKVFDKKNIVGCIQNDDSGKVCVRGQTKYDRPPIDVFKVIQDKTIVDTDIRQHDVLSRISPDVVIDHLFMNVPWPVTPRDGLSVTFFRLMNDGCIVNLSFGYSDDSVCPEIAGCIRSELTIAGFVLKPNTEGGTDCTYMLKVLLIIICIISK